MFQSGVGWGTGERLQTWVGRGVTTREQSTGENVGVVGVVGEAGVWVKRMAEDPLDLS